MVGGVRADDGDDRGVGAPGVVQVGQPVPQPGAQVKQGCRGSAGHPGVAVGCAGGHPFEQDQHPPHLRHRVQLMHEVHLGGARIHETHVHTRVHQGLHQRPRRDHVTPPYVCSPWTFNCGSARAYRQLPGAASSCQPVPGQPTLADDPEEAGDDQTVNCSRHSRNSGAERRAAGVVPTGGVRPSARCSALLSASARKAPRRLVKVGVLVPVVQTRCVEKRLFAARAGPAGQADGSEFPGDRRRASGDIGLEAGVSPRLGAITIGTPGYVGCSIGEWNVAESGVRSAAIRASSSACWARPSCRSSSARLWWVSGSFGLAAIAAR